MASLTQEQLTARIRHQDDDLVVVDKPFDLPSTGRQLDDPDSLQHALIERFGRMTWAVHQLDADTSGVNVFVRHRHLVKVWQARLRFPAAHKSYLAIVHGAIDGANHLLDRPIEGRLAVTQLQVLARSADASLLRLGLETGRTHQIRIHLQAFGHPLLGESWYRQPSCRRHLRQALHAWRIELADGEPALLSAPLPPDLEALAGELGLDLTVLAGA